MRFAWQRKKQGLEDPKLSIGERLVLISYNAIWWLPVVLVIFDVWSYRTGAVVFLAITVIRALVNLYRNNILTFEAAQRFPLRSA